MLKVDRRTALATAMLTGISVTTGSDQDAQEEGLTKDQEFVVAAGMTKQEAGCWKKAAEVAGAFFELPEMHPMDQQEVATAVHVIQNKLLGRPTYRKYLELAKAAEARADEK